MEQVEKGWVMVSTAWWKKVRATVQLTKGRPKQK